MALPIFRCGTSARRLRGLRVVEAGCSRTSGANCNGERVAAVKVNAFVAPNRQREGSWRLPPPMVCWRLSSNLLSCWPSQRSCLWCRNGRAAKRGWFRGRRGRSRVSAILRSSQQSSAALRHRRNGGCFVAEADGETFDGPVAAWGSCFQRSRLRRAVVHFFVDGAAGLSAVAAVALILALPSTWAMPLGSARRLCRSRCSRNL